MPKNQDVIAIYSRKSRFTGKGESIGNQVELCRAYIRTAFGDAYADGAVVFEDEGFSGGNLNRPDFKRMMKAARDHQFKAVVVYRLDRISRNISDFSALIEELGRLEIDFVSIRESFDTSSPMGRAMMYIASVFSQLERETIAERIRDNMHELAKTGRWLGGTTPTGYTSEAVKTITVDGKSKRACKLKVIPEEADIVRKIYDLYIETDSLTMTEAELLRQHIKTKTGRNFTRFSIRGILQNPVYLIADQDAYQYFVEKQADLFSAPEEFDGVRGILAYNRTDQEKGRATVYLPTSEWIVSVGQHPGLIPAKTWIKVQESLERNKSKGYRKPRSNEALLTGLLWCRCGNRMYPKLSKRFTADGKPIYTYVCKMKERSKRSLCNRRNAHGNLLDAAIVEQVKSLASNDSTFLCQLEKSKRFYTGNREEYDKRLEDLRQQQAETQRKINALVDSLADFGDSTAAIHVRKRLEELHAQDAELQARITELEGLTAQHALSGIEFDLMRQLLTVFRDGIDEMTVEQKRAAIRTVVRKVIWDGQYAHVVLFGAVDEDVDWRDAADVLPALDIRNPDGNEEDTEDLEPFGDVDYEDEEISHDIPAETPWGEDSK
ncbi:recombinase family protein [uncultured Subdoligranulum sp.]|uniref:recombinase family protein n=1 Tax=uncultured Subdoligranulum sp. TaxID=512298 RepID=UPI0025F4CF11|nr:recombinase family protein [uncultured Subdoligranulum sp.]